jgi:hypothetical protein
MTVDHRRRQREEDLSESLHEFNKRLKLDESDNEINASSVQMRKISKRPADHSLEEFERLSKQFREDQRTKETSCKTAISNSADNGHIPIQEPIQMIDEARPFQEINELLKELHFLRLERRTKPSSIDK